MPKKLYAIVNDGPRRLEINWNGGLYYHGGIRILFDGNLVGVIPPHVDLKQEQKFALPDSSTLSVNLDKGALRVLRDGKDLALIEHPQRILISRWSMLALIGLINLAGGFLLLLGIWKPQNPSPNIALLLICGILFVGISLWASRKSIIAFVFGMVLFGFQIIVFQADQGEFDLWITLIAISMMAGWCFEGITAIRKISRQINEKQ